MLAFHNDYHAGAHPKVLKALVSTNGAAQDGYGADEYSESARARIRHAIEDEQAEVFFVTGGTQTNQLVIDTMLSAWEGVISADTGHVSVHEAGAIEFCGHKVLTVPSENGLMDPNDVRSLARNFYDDPNHEHMVFPGMVYLSYPSEYGTLYSADQLHEIRAICDEFNMCLFIDGARLAYALGSASEHLSLTQLAQIADAFYAGGTKAGALLGEAVIFPAGRAMGVQFDALFTDGLYERIGTQADELAQRLVGVMRSHGFEEYLISSTNQQFFVMNKKQFEALSAVAQVSLWEAPRNGRYIVRMVTGWDTTEEMIDQLDKALSI